MEIERKWRLEKLPDCCTNDLRMEIDQGYIFDGEYELRLRRSTTIHYMTVKGSGHLARHEWESVIPKWVFDGLWNKAIRIIKKDRFTITRDVGIDSYRITKFQFDEYKSKLMGLITVECEFNSLLDAESFILPDWVGPSVEVTNDPQYKNKNLAKLESFYDGLR